MMIIVKPFSIQDCCCAWKCFKKNKKLQSDAAEEYMLDPLKVLYNNLKITNEEGSSSLTQKETDLLKFLAQHPIKF